MISGFKGGAGGSGEVIPNGVFVGAFEGFFEAIPGGGARKEGLAHMEAKAVVVGIEEPGGYVISLGSKLIVMPSDKLLCRILRFFLWQDY